ncbi:MAG: ABC transporter permease [Burkholderiales bacterium]|nr:ABC transporter permease [Burkholderiales bacterium]
MAMTKQALFTRTLLRGLVSIAVFLILWELGARSKQWLMLDAFEWLRSVLAAVGWDKKYLPWIGAVPAPTEVLKAWVAVLGEQGYWHSWYMSFFRVMGGFIAAMIIGIPFGLLLAVSRTAYGIGFPVFEVLRPIPPLAWVPASIIFWPTQELSITFVTFLGAFYTIVINVVGGAKSIDVRYFQAARSMGSSQWDIFRRIILPGTLPSIVVGSAVGMGITWEVVVAAEMISGGGSQIGGTSGGGLGFFIWNSYVGGSYEQIVVGMISIGIAGFLSSELLRALGKYVTPWLRLR